MKTATLGDLRKSLGDSRPLHILDVRLIKDRDADPVCLPGAVWRDPGAVSQWAKTLPEGKIVVYCVHGAHVSQGVAKALHSMGREAFYLEGGIEGWKEAGRELEKLP